MRLIVGDNAVDLSSDGDDVFTGAFFDRDVDRRAAIEPGAAGFLLEAVDHPGDILEIDRLALMGAHHQAVNLLRVS